ncbi:MAG TPA: methionyl-tRNA formyltransferase [Blastocatellia bacterium]|nr:methionyl-tRNA formyltransferase [Blastocatellia bacterium]
MNVGMRVIFMGTPEFAVPSLARLVEDGHDVVAVFTQPDKPAGRGNKLQPPPVKLFAIEHDIPVHQPARIKNNEEVRAVFKRSAADACIVAAYGKILPQWLLDIPRLGCINVHASILPKYRGAAPINWAIANGERETGITIMQMDAGMDTGPVLDIRRVEIGSGETAPELSERLSRIGAEALCETLPRIERGEIQPIAQDDSQATYAPMLKREAGLIDWSMTAREIANRVRAFQPWPGTYTLFRGSRLIFWRASETTASEKIEPATITGIDKDGITIACAGPSALHIEEVQVEGKRRAPARDFANGMRLSRGDRISDSAG